MSGKRDDDWIVAQTLTGGDAQVDQTVRTRVPDPGSDPLQSLDTLVGDDEDEDDGFDLIGRADVASEAPHETTQEITGSAVLEVSSHDPAWVSEPDPGDEDEHEGTPWVASDEPPSADEAAPALRSRLTQELVDNAEGTPFAVATDEILLEDLLDSEPFDDAFIDAPLDDAPIDSPRTHHFSIEAHELEADDFDETAYWRDRIAAIREEQTRLRNTRREPDLLRELGRIYEQRLNDPDEAIAIYERLREMSADDEEAFMALDRLYQGAQEIDKLIELLLDRQDQIDERDEKAEVLARVAELYVKVRRRDEAEVVIDAAVALSPSHERVQGVLKMLAQSDPEDAGSSLFPASAPSSPPPAAPPPQDPVEELETRLAAAGEVSDRVSILDSLATLYRRRNRPSEAARCLNEIISLDRRRDSAYRQLAEIYRQHQRHSDLARVLELYARAIAPQARVEILRQLAALYEGPLGDVASAVASYERLHAILPDDAPTIWALIRYHEERGDAHSLLEILRDASQRLRGSERVEIFYRQGKIMAEALGDSAGAEEHYQRALENDPSHAPSIAELTEIYRARRDWGKAVRMMLAAEAASSAPAQKARYLCEAGVTSLEHLGDERRAQEMLARTLEIDPDHEEAAEALAGLLFRRQEFDGLVPVLDVLLRKTRREDQSRFIDLNHKLGVVSVALGDRERGERAFRKVLELEPHHAEALIGLGDLAFEAGDYRQAQAAYRQIGDTLNTLEPSRRREVLLRQGRSARDSGLAAEAKSCLDRALEEFPRDPEILADLASLQLDGGDWHGALTSKEALLNRAEGSEARDLLLEIGDIYRDKVSDASRAEGAYRRALTFVEGDHVLLHRLLDLYSESSQWEKTVEVCERLAGRRDEAPRVRAKYLGVAASLYDKHLDRPDEALRFYNRVLDVDPDELKAFSAIDAICTRLKDWRTLEQNYGKMLKRLPAEGKTELKVMLWHNLGEVLRSRRRDFEGAIAAFEVAYKLDPKDIQRRRILGELYRNAGSSYVDRAIGLYQTFVNEDPQQGESCRVLRKLHFDAGHYDRAWGLSGVLIFIDQADREIVDFYRHYRRRSIPRARARLLDDHWPRYLYHPTQDPYVSAVFSILAGPMAAMTARSHAQFSLKRKDCYDYEGQQEHPFGRLFAYVQGVLHAPAFDLFLDPEKPASLQLAHTTEATSLVAGANILRGERPEKELAFLVGKQLALLRPDLFLRVALPARGQLQGAFVAARRLVDPSLPLPRGEEKAIIKGVERLRKQLSYPQIEQLGQILSRIEDPDRVDLRKWWDAVELTTDRVAMLLCNDLGVAGKMIAAEPSAVGLNPRARVDELVRFAASDAYYHLRKDLGITIEETV